MGKTNKKRSNQFKPLVSVCTPTFNRRPFIPIMFDCFRNQTYPKDRIEWIIVDDGTDKIKDLVDSAQIPQIKYFELPGKMPLGAKRNYMHSKATGSIIVYMDDDDYYPPERISHAVEKLTENKEALCAGSSEIYVYFKHIQKMIQCGPYGPNHATAGTFAFKAELLKQTQYEEHAALAEEKAFLKNYTIPFVQLDPMKTILVFSHEHNTFDKRKMFENPHPQYFKESPKTINDFIKTEAESHIKDFFMSRIDGLLEVYEPGHPRMKPDVLVQMAQIEKERQAMAQQTNNAQIMIQRPGEEPKPLSIEEILQIMQQQQGHIQYLTQKIQELEIVNQQLQRMIYTNAGGTTPSQMGPPMNFSSSQMGAPMNFPSSQMESPMNFPSSQMGPPMNFPSSQMGPPMNFPSSQMGSSSFPQMMFQPPPGIVGPK